MIKIFISLILNTSFPILFAGPPVLSPNKINPQMMLKPLCYTDSRNCNIAQKFLNFPSSGNFQISSLCRRSNQNDAQRGFCIGGFPFLLEIKAFIDLPYLGQFQWRNQCLGNAQDCNIAKKVWSEVSHPLFVFNAVCSFPIPGFWNMDPIKMDQLGIFRCLPPNEPMELRVQAQRIK